MIAPRAASVLADLVQQPDALDAEMVKLWVVSGLSTWMNADSSLRLPQCLGLPGTAAAVRRAVRDHRIGEAAACLSGSAWSRAAALRQTFAQLRRRRFGLWQANGGPDALATRLERALWQAWSVGSEMPATTQAWANIVAASLAPSTTSTQA